MSDITVINDSQQSELVTNGLAKNGELYLKAAGSTDAGAIVVYDSGSWRTFANEAVSFSQQYSVNFDGTNDYVSVPNLATYLTNNATAISISAWIKLNTTSDGSYEILRVSDGSFGIYFSTYKSGSTFKSTICGFRTGGAYNQIINATNIFDGAWHHVVYTYDQPTNAIKGYIDGSLETPANTQASGSPAWSTYTRLDIGSNAGSSIFFNGLIDEVAVWSSVLSASDVTAIYNSGTPDDLSSYSPIGWWRMGDNDSGTGTTITDQGSEGNDGTLTNGPTFSTDIPS